MPRRNKSLSKPEIPIKPAVKIFRVRDSGTDGNLGIDSPRVGRPNGILSFPNCVITCFNRYPQHQQSILVSHFAFGLIILSVLANWGRIGRSCCGAYRAVSYLIEVLLHCKVVAFRSLT